MATQDLDDADANVRGAIKGSHPVWGRYARLSFPNWATKFFVDAMWLRKELAGVKPRVADPQRPLRSADDASETVDARVRGASTRRERGWLCTVNVATLMTMRRNPRAAAFVDHAALGRRRRPAAGLVRAAVRRAGCPSASPAST